MSTFCVLTAARIVYSLATPHMRLENGRLYLYDQHKFLSRIRVVELHEIRRIVRQAKQIGGVWELVAADECLIETGSQTYSVSPPHGDKEFAARLVSFLEQIMPLEDVRSEEEKQEIRSGRKKQKQWQVVTEYVFLFLSVGLLAVVIAVAFYY